MRFTESHEWVKVSEGEATIGITEYAQGELGEVVYVELPEVGREIKAGEEAAVLESTKAAADAYSPLTGTITAVNEALSDEPELLNHSPEIQGWLFKIKMSDPSEYDNLMDEEAYNKIIA